MEEISIYQLILDTAIEMGVSQWLAFIFNLIYVILAARENVWCWLFGFLGAVLSVFVYIDFQFYSEALLNIYYALISIYGWWLWLKVRSKPDGKGEEATKELSISRWPMIRHWQAIGLSIVLGLIWGYFWSHFGAAMPYIDACIASFSVITTYMVARKILENWLYWIVIDFVCIFVYLHRGIYLFAILFFVYCIIAILGYFNWKREMVEG